ncbi:MULTISPECIES: hypothetical protein [Hyphomonas]|jgi:uncharacterized lipoprotein YehR (DUF1307 family)|uniref:hypothetical protein n=1 Tax=Hyphomonas TaxID=85 RepID=UPI003514C76F
MKLVKPVAFATFALALTSCASSATTEKMSLEEGAQQECRTIEEFGSILPKRVCNNKATWAEIDERNKEQAKEFKEKIDSRYTPSGRDPRM